MEILRNQVPNLAIAEAEEFINILSEEELEWPSHRWHRGILQLLAYLPAHRGQLCDPQIVRQPKTTEPCFITFHLDEPPPYADGRQYEAIYGVAITKQSFQNGGVGFGHYLDKIVFPFLAAGDVVVFKGWEHHSPGLNLEDDPRIAVYFRFLEPQKT